MVSFEHFVFPGDKLGESSSSKAGFGSYCNDNKHEIKASVAGLKQIATVTDDKQVMTVKHWKKADRIPAVDDVVIAKIIGIKQHLAVAEIICINDKPLLHSCSGVIRQQDVRQLDTDSVQIFKCFRPSDIIKAKIISLGNQNDYYLSTSAPQFGVIAATSTMGYPMMALKWNKMQCTVTKVVEDRKVAKLDFDDHDSNEMNTDSLKPN